MKTIKPGTLFCDENGQIYEYLDTLTSYPKESYGYTYYYAHRVTADACSECNRQTTICITEKQFDTLHKIGEL